MSEPAFNPEDVHNYYSKHCFNWAWELMDKPERTAEENESMIQLAHASLWHWSQRADCSGKNLSIGYWQLSRIYTLVGDKGNAVDYAIICLEKTPKDDPFLLGYAHEALARAEMLYPNVEKAKSHHAEATRLAESIEDAESKQMLLNDLENSLG